MKEHELFNNQVVEAVMTGSMERKVFWISSEMISLHKRIKYHIEKIPYAEDSILREELRARLDLYQKRLKEFNFDNMRRNYITKLKLIYSKETLPPSLYLGNHVSLYYPNKQGLIAEFSVDVKFVINFEERKRVYWAVESVFPQTMARSSGRSPIFTYECKDLERIPNILLTLPSLITTEFMVNSLDNFPAYVHYFQ